MLYESVVQVNLFATYLAPGQPSPEFRDGIVRARAAFGHPILAGCFGATLVPVFVWLWKMKGSWVRGLNIDGGDSKFEHAGTGVCGRLTRPPFVVRSTIDEGGPLGNRDRN